MFPRQPLNLLQPRPVAVAHAQVLGLIDDVLAAAGRGSGEAAASGGRGFRWADHV